MLRKHCLLITHKYYKHIIYNQYCKFQSIFIPLRNQFNYKGSIKYYSNRIIHSEYNFEDMSLPNAKERLVSFRKELTKLNIDCFIQSTNDAHQVMSLY